MCSGGLGCGFREDFPTKALCEVVQQSVDVNRFGLVAGETNVFELAFEALHGVGGEGDDRDRATTLTQPPRGSRAVHDRHAHIHQHKVEGFDRNALKRNPAVIGLAHPQPHVFQQDMHELPILHPVVDHQHASRREAPAHVRDRHRHHGRGSQLGGPEQRREVDLTGIEPQAEGRAMPGELLTVMSPPIARAKPRLIVRPRPVPPKRWVVDASACTNGSNTDSSLSAAMPMPVSWTSMQ